MEELKLSNQLCFPLYAASKEVVSKYTPILKRFDLTYTQYIAMLVLFEEKEMKVTELGERLYLDSGTLSPLLKKLENKGFLRRIRDKNDERNVKISLTEEGKKIESELVIVPKTIGSCINLSRDESITLYTLLYKLLNNIKDPVL